MDRDLLDLEKISYRKSWQRCVPEFAGVLAKLCSGDIQKNENCKLINVSSGKYVYRGKEGGFDFAIKVQDNEKPFRYILRPSLPAREALHYQWMTEAGFPVPRVLAVGENRKNLNLKSSLLVTEFVDNTMDGRVFMPEGKMRHGFEALRHAYVEKHMLLLAELHDLNLYHKAFHPRNLLFRGETPETLEVFWIDIARMRPAGNNLRRAVIVDLHTFFRDMLLSKEETAELLAVYLNAVDKKIFSGTDELLDELINFKRRLFSKKKYKLFG